MNINKHFIFLQDILKFKFVRVMHNLLRFFQEFKCFYQLSTFPCVCRTVINYLIVQEFQFSKPLFRFFNCSNALGKKIATDTGGIYL